MTERPRRRQPAHPAAKTRSSTSCTSAGFTVDPVLGRPPSRHLRRPGREDPLPEGAGRHGRRAAADRRVRRERLPVRQPADRREAARTSGATTRSPSAPPRRPMRATPSGSAPWEEFRGMVAPSTPRASRSSSTSSSTTPPKGATTGPTYNFRGLDNRLYYMLDDQGRYLNFTGCGNTINSNHPVVRNLLLSCLRNWVAEAGVDGFRFDLASVLGRDQRGERPGRAPGGRDDLRGRAALRHQADRRALGRGRALPGRHASPAAPAGRSGTAGTATTSAASGGASRA